MPPTSVHIELFEPVIFLRGQSAVGEDARGRRRAVDFDAPPSQLRGLLTLHLAKSSRIKDISVELRGVGRTDWPEGIGHNRLELGEESCLIKQGVSLFDARLDPTPRRRANSIGPGIACDSSEGWSLGAYHDPDRASSSNPTTPRARGEGSNKNHNSNGASSESGLAKVAQVAARAGTSLLPPTVVKELQLTAKPKKANAPSPQRPHFGRSGSAGGVNLQRTQAAPSPRPGSANGRSLDPSPGPSQPSTHRSLDPPPSYEQHISSAPATQSPLAVRAADALDTTQTRCDREGAADTGAASRSGQRSILHPAGRQERAERSSSHVGPGVRFGPAQEARPPADSQSAMGAPSGYLASSPLGSVGAANTATNSTNSTPSRPTSPSTRVASSSSTLSSAPNSRRASVDGMHAASKASSPGAPARSRKSGIKGLLGGLLKEADKDKERGLSEVRDPGHDWNEAPSEWKEFKKGTYTYAISLPLPAALPPTLHADFGSNVYTLRGHVTRAGPLTPNLSDEREVVLVHAPDENANEENESIVVERTWEDTLGYAAVVSGRSFPVGAKIPVWFRLVALDKVRIHRIVATLEERTDYYAKGRRVARHEVPRRWTMLKLTPPEGHAALLPVISDDSDALDSHPLTPYAEAATHTWPEADREMRASSSLNLLDPQGPWELAAELQTPTCPPARINMSTNHKKSNIAVHHTVKLSIRVEKLKNSTALSKGKPQLFDINIECPIALTHSHTAHAWLSLPDYWSLPPGDTSLLRGLPIAPTGSETSTPLLASSAPRDTYGVGDGYADEACPGQRELNGTPSQDTKLMSAEARDQLRHARERLNSNARDVDLASSSARSPSHQSGLQWLALSSEAPVLARPLSPPFGSPAAAESGLDGLSSQASDRLIHQSLRSSHRIASGPGVFPDEPPAYPASS
ncbi:hypothetical protein IE81DRAFT_171581 [Ceraceosorus guamensis]|uniref:Arrestin C-terminal-like domain-containing protein n=1 Tax=Ceraceosorus guamensis TaxID=1522189 RepID=A0A316VVT1_9BASI|nr:hypothetical protein IE81DRAFT_171581 [Ceraceosorus guamensis]PWN41552.1 hypothetical protein IE81DRAFT_171581 [Ceraceosorus guamensis]